MRSLICWCGTESGYGGVSGGAFGDQRSGGAGAAGDAAAARRAFGGQRSGGVRSAGVADLGTRVAPGALFARE